MRQGFAPAPQARPPPSWAPCCSTDILLTPIYTYVPPNNQIQSQNPNSTAVTFCIHEIPSWGLFRSSVGGGIDDGGLLHQHHSPSMKCEQFTSSLRVHSYQLDGFFSLFGSQYKVLPLSCGDLFDVIFFCGVFVETDELWVYDQVYL